MFQLRNDIYNKISNKLIDWWRIYGRNFPWRNTDDPYRIIIAETMLHRTKASQVEPIFNKFINRFPNIEALSKADTTEIIDILKPLGLNWRINLIVEMVEQMKKFYGGKIPRERQNLISLSGVGDYVASAVRCFAFGYPEIIIDTNTSRIISRIFGFEERGEMRRRREVREAYRLILDKKRTREFNYALLDLGASMCTPKNSKCFICPVSEYCKKGKNEVNKLEKSL
jgi:A/G-specific adenine glycosylase